MNKGQEVAILSAFGDRDYSFGWTVTRVTPKSKEVVVEGKNHQGDTIERRFDQFGYEMERGSSRYRARLESDVQGAKEAIVRKQMEIEAFKLLQHVKLPENIKYTWGKSGMLREIEQLEENLRIARAVVEKII